MKKIIVISGGNRGLGKEITKTLLKNSNNRVAIIARSINNQEKDNFIAFRGNITNIHSISEFIDKIYSKWNQIDVLVNNAGIVSFKPFLNYTEEDYRNIFNVNVKGSWLMTQYVIKRAKKSCYIINMGSTRSITGAPNKLLYSMSKAALRSMTQCINAEFKERKIYSTIVCPGSFKTVPIREIAKIIKNLIALPLECHIPEIIIGGTL